MRVAGEWEHILKELGVAPARAAKMGPIFAATIKENTFSKGERDLLDFLPTVLHESGMLAKLKESGKYSAKRIVELGNASKPGSRWRSLVPRANALGYDGTPESEARFFEACYAGRMGNGPEGAGDGALYPGRGFIGVTGKDNYRWLAERSGQDLLSMPWLLEGPYYALELSIDWWEGKVPDSILGDERAIRKVVNGGIFGLKEVNELAAKTREVVTWD